jgi:CcmD family protein
VTHAAYVFAGYLVTFAVLALYVAWLRAKARSLARTLDTGAAPGGVPPAR